MPERSECIDCGNEVAVNKDGSLRKHSCVEPEVAAPAEVEQPDPAPTEAVERPEPPPAGPAERAPRRGRCYAEPCRRPEVADGVGLCGAHYALRPDLRKVARHA